MFSNEIDNLIIVGAVVALDTVGDSDAGGPVGETVDNSVGDTLDADVGDTLDGLIVLLWILLKLMVLLTVLLITLVLITLVVY